MDEGEGGVEEGEEEEEEWEKEEGRVYAALITDEKWRVTGSD